METRKIQKVGTSTLTVSLPKEWVRQHELEKGDQIYIVDEDDVLKLLPGEAARARMEKRVTNYIINADAIHDQALLERVVVGNYILGRERLVIESESRISQQHLQEIRGAVRRLMGLGIIEETANRVVLQCSIEPAKYPMNPLLKRLYIIGATMVRESIEALVTSDVNLAEDAVSREEDADRMYWLILRLILSAQLDPSLLKDLGMEAPMENVGNRLVAKDLESIADRAEEIAITVKNVLEKDAEIDTRFMKHLKELSEDILDQNEKAVAALLTRDIKSANHAINLAPDIEEAETKLVQSLYKMENGFSIVSARNILEGLISIGGLGQSMAVVAINRYLERSTPLCHAVEEPSAGLRPS
jgi:phosphate uptake regulator